MASPRVVSIASRPSGRMVPWCVVLWSCFIGVVATAGAGAGAAATGAAAASDSSTSSSSVPSSSSFLSDIITQVSLEKSIRGDVRRESATEAAHLLYKDCCANTNYLASHCADEDPDEDSAISSSSSSFRTTHGNEADVIHNNEEEDDILILRLLTWEQKKSRLQLYADAYNQQQKQKQNLVNTTKNRVHVEIYSVPSLKELEYEVLYELNKGSNEDQDPTNNLYDGYVVPPLFLGSMYQQHNGVALANWNNPPPRTMEELLPYYQYNVATMDGHVKGLPILGGTQQYVVYRKPYLDALNLPTPKTWQDWILILQTFHEHNSDEALVDRYAGSTYPIYRNPMEQPVYGACLGLLNEAGCTKVNYQQQGSDKEHCESDTMTYMGMVLSSMTQSQGNTSGWMMDFDPETNSNLAPLFQPYTLDYVLEWFEAQVRYGPPTSNPLVMDTNQAMTLFRDGQCAMTITSEYDPELFEDDTIGVIPLPGSDLILDRHTPTSSSTNTAPNSSSMQNCTWYTCPYGATDVRTEAQRVVDDDYGGEDVSSSVRIRNLVPFGSVTQSALGTVSGWSAPAVQDATKLFYQYVLEAHPDPTRAAPDVVPLQPMTYRDLEEASPTLPPEYAALLMDITSSTNAAIPFRIPNAYQLYTELDNRIYQYLLDGNYTQEKRQQTVAQMTTAFEVMIEMYDHRFYPAHMQYNTFPTDVFYAKSLGVYVPVPAEDRYIGWWTRIAMYCLGGLSCCTSIVLALWVYRYQHERVVRASQPVFLWLICGGTFSMALAVFTSGVEDDIASYRVNAIMCQVTYWFYTLGFAAVITAMFSKLYMLGKVLQKPRREQRIQITRQDLLLPSLVIFGINVAVLTVWTIFDPEHWERVPINESSYSLNLVEESTYGVCNADTKMIYLPLLFILDFLIVVLALVQAYECRRITTEYSESLWISVSVATTTQVWAVSSGVLLYLIKGRPREFYIVECFMIFFTTFPVLLFIFVPKMVYLHRAKRDGKDEKAHPMFKNNNDINAYSSNDPATGTTVSPNTSDETPPKQEGVIAEVKSLVKTNGENSKSESEEGKGTIGIRITQFSFLDNDEVEELEENVEKAKERNDVLRNTMERLRDNLEERKYAASNNYYAFDYQKDDIAAGAKFHHLGGSNRSIYSSCSGNSRNSGIGDKTARRHSSSGNNSESELFLGARPVNLRHSRVERRATYYE